MDRVARDFVLALRIGQLRTSVSSWAFLSVYLLYPGTCLTLFSMFKCRELDSKAEYLYADAEQVCRTPGGDYSFDYYTFRTLAFFVVFLIPVGIPLTLGIMMYKQRERISQNPNYLTLVFIKPLFQYFRPTCYMWEIYFM